MVWRLLRGAVVVLLLVVSAVAVGLVWLHMEIERERAPLPVIGELLQLEKTDDLPVKVSVIETAHQGMPRSAVLDPSRDPNPSAPYLMTHPSFVVEWADGRLLLIDTGMTPQKAIEFGDLIERFGGAGPMLPGTPVATALGKEASRVKGIVFTHLHIDHVDGLRELCGRIGHPVKIFMTAPQLDAWTPLTAEGKRVIEESTCAEPVRLGGAAFLTLDGFPGVRVIAAGGHTPGSQIIAVATRDRTGVLHRYLFAGDVANVIDGVRLDAPKPFLYRTVIVPEDDDRLGELRRYLRALEKDHGFSVVVSHDGGALKESGIPTWGQ